MRRSPVSRRAGVAAAIGLVLLPGCALAGPVAPPVQSSAAAAKEQAWLAQVARWGQRFQAVVIENAEATSALIDGAETAVDYFESGDRNGGEAWFEDWSPKQRARLEQLKRTASDMPPPPSPEGFTVRPPLARKLASVGDAIRALAVLTANTHATGERYIGLIGEAATGSEAALGRLAPLTLDAMLINLRGENSMTEFARATAIEGSPQSKLIVATLEANLGVTALVEFQRAEVLGEEPERAAYVARIRKHADAAGSAAREIWPLAQKLAERFSSQPGGGDFQKRIIAAMRTFEPSAEVEIGVAEALQRVATELERGEEGTSDAILAVLTDIEVLVAKRVEADKHRRSLIAGGS